MKLPSVIVLDCGSTLIHPDVSPLRSRLLIAGAWPVSSQHLRASFHAALAIEQGIRPLPEDSRRRMDLAHAWCFLANCPAQMSSLFADALNAPDLYRVVEPDTHQVLKELRARGIRLAVVANGEGQLDEELRATGLKDLLDVSIDSHVFGAQKPHASIFDAVCERLRVDASEAWFVGDSLVNDYLGALRAGFVRSVLFDRDDLWPTLPIPRVTHLSDLVAMVDRDTNGAY